MPMNNAERAKHAEQGLMQDCQSKADPVTITG